MGILRMLILLQFLLVFFDTTFGTDCETYNNNIFCQAGATNCISCQAGGDDSVGLPCNGVRLKLFASDDDFCGWCPDTCVPYIEEGERCWQTVSGSQIHGMCGPQLTCQKFAGEQVSTCKKMQGRDCLEKQAAYDMDLEGGLVGMDQMRPVCDDHGYWAPVQCTGSDVCRCVDKKTGDPIHGFETNMTAALSSMTCGCAREAMELKEMGCGMKVKYDGPAPKNMKRYKQEYEECLNTKESYYPSMLRCLPNGNYDAAQCIEQTTDAPNNPAYSMEMCFCYEEGKPLNSSMAPINIAHIVLECHRENNKTGHYEGFYRPCEKSHVDLTKNIANYKADGATYISTEKLPDCDIDGFYSKVQKSENPANDGLCVDRFGKPLEGYVGEFATMDCECAVISNLTSQWGEKPSCTVDGSYKKQQCRGGKCYCVDRYGRQCAKEVDQTETLDCAHADDDNEKAPARCPASRNNSGK